MKYRWDTNFQINKSLNNSLQMLDELKGNFFPSQLGVIFCTCPQLSFSSGFIQDPQSGWGEGLELASKVGRPSGYNT